MQSCPGIITQSEKSSGPLPHPPKKQQEIHSLHFSKNIVSCLFHFFCNKERRRSTSSPVTEAVNEIRSRDVPSGTVGRPDRKEIENPFRWNIPAISTALKLSPATSGTIWLSEAETYPAPASPVLSRSESEARRSRRSDMPEAVSGHAASREY